MKKISEDWARVPEQEKAKMQEMYEKEKEDYAIKLAKVPQNILDKVKEEKDLKKSNRLNRATSKVKTEAEKELKSLLEKLNKPKKPMSSYLMFCMDRRPHLPPQLKSNEIIAHLAKEWNQASPTIKENYNKEHAKLAAKYEEELEKWSMQMHSQGRTEEITRAEMKLAQAKRNNKK